MATEILMPALSPTMEEGTLAKWLVKEGDTVSSGDILAEIETDKATMEFEAVDEGIVGKILIAEGTSGVKVNTPIAVMVEEGEEVPADAGGAPKADAPKADAPKEAAKTPEKTPDTDSRKVETEQTADAKAGAPKDATPAPAAPTGADGERVFASPLARRIARDKGLDLASVKGSGPHGRIVKADVEGAKPAAAASSAAAPDAEAAPAPAAAPAASTVSADAVKKLFEGRPYEEITLNGMRRTIATRLTEAKSTIPHFYLRREVILDPLMELRAQLNSQLSGRGVKLSVNDFIIKASALAMQAVPEANAVWAGDRVLKMKSSDVAVAVAIDGGLYTPVLKDAHFKSLSALSTEMKEMAGRAKEKKLAPDEYLGGSFAISNLGMFGVENFDAVINPPQSAILAVGASKKKPVVKDDGEIGVATVMSLTISCDHRVMDGALGAIFFNAICENLANPLLMLA